MADESIVEINKAYYPLIARIVLISVGLDVLFFALYMVLQSTGTFLWIWVVFYLIKIVIFIYLSVRAAYGWTGTYYHIDEQSGLLIRKIGLHFPKETAYSLKNLHSVYSYQNPLSKVLKYGDLALTFTNREGNKEELRISEVVNPNSYKEFFDKYLAKGMNG